MIKKFIVLGVILLVCSLTPASATNISEVTKQAEQYTKNFKKEQSFFVRMKSMSQGFSLLNKMKKALEDDYRSDSESTTELLKFRNSESSDRVIPDECWVSASLISQTIKGISGSHIQENVDENLKDHIVQLVNEKSYIRYGYVKEIELNGVNPHVTLITNGKCEKTLKLAEFKKEYTGILFSVPSEQNPLITMASIVELQKNELQKRYIELDKRSWTFGGFVTLFGVFLLLLFPGHFLLIFSIGILAIVIEGSFSIRDTLKVKKEENDLDSWTKQDKYTLSDESIDSVQSNSTMSTSNLCNNTSANNTFNNSTVPLKT